MLEERWFETGNDLKTLMYFLKKYLRVEHEKFLTPEKAGPDIGMLSVFFFNH